jgi:predicted phosphodiesterase
MIAIISDIHGNLEALEAVLADIRRQRVDAIYCLGDIIGYGPNPRECLDAAMRWNVCMLGNHEYAVLHGADAYNEIAERSINWTVEQLKNPFPNRSDADARWSFLENLPRSYAEGDFLFLHGSPLNLLNDYVFPEHVKDRAKMSLIFAMIRRYCFNGHTHVPGIFTENAKFQSAQDLKNTYRLDGRKILCNVGSVGQPRDGDWRSCYVLLDGDTIQFRRVEYDIEKIMRRIRATCNLDYFSADRLREGR